MEPRVRVTTGHDDVSSYGRPVSGKTVRRVALAVVALALVWLVSIPVRVWWDARQEDHRPSDAIVVLGAAQYNGVPSPVLEARLRKAWELWNDDVAPVIVTVGGAGAGDVFTEGGAGRDWLVGKGLPADAVISLPEGNDTQSSLDAIATLFDDQGWSTTVLVTDPWHTFRSKAMADAVGIDAVAAPVRSGPVVQTRSAQARYIFRESLAYLKWRLTGNSDGSGLDAF